MLVQLIVAVLLGLYGFYITEKWNKVNLVSKVVCVVALLSCYMLSFDGYIRSKELMRNEAKLKFNH